MLDKHLIAKTCGAANEKNIALWRDYRITIFESRLFRLEKNEKCVWRDEATQSIWFRNMPPVKFNICDNGDSLKIETDAAVLVVMPELKDSYVIIDGKNVPLDNDGNLLGTCRTLDACDGDRALPDPWGVLVRNGEKIELGVGVCSKNGVAVIDDGDSLDLACDGMLAPRKNRGIDKYIFAYGTDYRAAVKALYKITGAPPKLPRYALGNWQSRYYVYTDRSYLTLMDKFSDRDVPLTVATVDMDWHYTDIEGTFGATEKGRCGDEYGGTSGWTGYSWNKSLFPDYKAFLNELKARDLVVTLNIHPADGIRWFEDCYPKMAKAMGVDPNCAKKIAFDIKNDRFINNYFSVVHKPYEKDGVGFWWIDWQQSAGNVDCDPLWSLNHYHYSDIAQNGDGIILSRYAGVGSHRYPIGFSGDTYATWDTLGYLPYFTATASNIGYTWWSHDIGGHMMGDTDFELYLRSVQYGVFSPINRLHCCAMKGVTKEPWFFGNGAGLIAEEFLRFRHRMIPFLYTANHKTHEAGRALVEPMYYDYPNIENAYLYADREYLFGGLIVAPIVKPNDADGYGRADLWLPQGRFTDIFTGDEYDISSADGKCVTLMRRSESIPVLAKGGTILPLSLDKGNSVENPKKLEIRVYSGTGEFTLYEDRGDKKFHTCFQVNERERGKVELSITSRGDSNAIPTKRKLKIVFENIKNGELRLLKNGKKLSAKPEYCDRLAFTIDFDSAASYTIYAVDLDSEFDKLLSRITDVVTRAEDSVAIKDMWLNKLGETKTVDRIREFAESSELKLSTKQKIEETLLFDALL